MHSFGKSFGIYEADGKERIGEPIILETRRRMSKKYKTLKEPDMFQEMQALVFGRITTNR